MANGSACGNFPSSRGAAAAGTAEEDKAADRPGHTAGAVRLCVVKERERRYSSVT